MDTDAKAMKASHVASIRNRISWLRAWLREQKITIDAEIEKELALARSYGFTINEIQEPQSGSERPSGVDTGRGVRTASPLTARQLAADAMFDEMFEQLKRLRRRFYSASEFIESAVEDIDVVIAKTDAAIAQAAPKETE